MSPTYYRGCWHVVSRDLFSGYRHSSSPVKEVYNSKTFILHAALLRQGFPHCAIFPTAASRRSLGRVSVPMWPINLSVRLLIVDLVGRYLTNYLIRRGPLFPRIAPLITAGCPSVILCGISTSFPVLSPGKRQVAHALLTRPPLSISFRPWPKPWASGTASFDLHVLSTPPAFILSQDQTLRYISLGLTLETSLTFLNLLILSLRSTHLRVSPGALLSGLFFKLKFFGKRLLKKTSSDEFHVCSLFSFQCPFCTPFSEAPDDYITRFFSCQAFFCPLCVFFVKIFCDMFFAYF